MLEFITNQNLPLSYTKNLCERQGDLLTAPIHKIISNRVLTILAIVIFTVKQNEKTKNNNQGQQLKQKSSLTWVIDTFCILTVIGIFFRTIGRLANKDFRSLYFSK